MLWRPTYRTLAARDVSTPALNVPDPCVLIGGFAFAAYREISVWKRLMSSEEISLPTLVGFFISDPSAQDSALLESLIPPSEQATSFIFPDRDSAWKELVGPASDDQCFAAVLRGTRAEIMMKGIPTEDAWDAFREAFG
jgi:hypothetical protein